MVSLRIDFQYLGEVGVFGSLLFLFHKIYFTKALITIRKSTDEVPLPFGGGVRGGVYTTGTLLPI